MTIKIGNREVGEGKPPFIIAEIGSNWRTLEDCLTSIALAKASGADAVKFQAFTAEALYGNGPHLEGAQVGTLPLDWLPTLKAKADSVGIEFMCTAFSPELVDAVDPFVNVHKVASAEMTHVRILERIRATGKPVFMSTGASSGGDIRKALAVLQECNDDTYNHDKCNRAHTSVVLLYCVAAYPARRVRMSRIGMLKDNFNLPVGFSDHTTDVITIPWFATIVYGACVIEKHVNFIEGLVSPDSPHSLSSDEFKEMCFWINRKVQSSGTLGDLGPTVEENPFILRHNRRLIATKDIQVGDTLEEGKNFGIHRSLKDDRHGYSPFKVVDVHGRSALKPIQAGDSIGPGDV